jgi:hypothetical protein
MSLEAINHAWSSATRGCILVESKAVDAEYTTEWRLQFISDTMLPAGMKSRWVKGDTQAELEANAWKALEPIGVVFVPADQAKLPELEEQIPMLADFIITGVEGGLYSWFEHRNYQWKDLGDGVMYASVEIRVVDEDGEPEGEWMLIEPATLRTAFNRIAYGETGIANTIRASLIGSYLGATPGDLDVNDVDLLFQVLLLGEVTFG